MRQLDDYYRGYYALDLSYCLYYDKSRGWGIKELACEGKRAMNFGQDFTHISDADALVLFLLAAALPCMKSHDYPRIVPPGGQDIEDLFEVGSSLKGQGDDRELFIS